MGYRCLFETSSERDKTANGSAEYGLWEQTMVRKIPRDHKGLYACEPNNHGIQENLSSKEPCTKKDGKQE